METHVDGRVVRMATGGAARDNFATADRVVVLIHGAGMDHSVWSVQTRWLAVNGCRPLAVDLPGHGRSEGPPLTSVPDLAAWLVRLLDGLGISNLGLVGHSMGALVALAAAARLGRRVEGLLLCGAAQAMPVHPELLAAAVANDPRAGHQLVAWGFGRAAQGGGAGSPGQWMTGSGLALLRRAKPDVLAADLAACAAWAEGAATASGVTCPTHVLIGAEDRMTPPAGGTALAACIPGASTTVLAGCGHMMMIEAPDAVIDTMATMFAGRRSPKP